jgi:hypothetical protein
LLPQPEMLNAESGSFGAGFILGSPSGITGKMFFDGNNALDFGLGVVSGDDLYCYADYLKHFSGVLPLSDLALYIGLGPGYHRYEKERKKRDDERENRFELRVPLGLEYAIRTIPLGVFLEIAPALRVIPEIGFDIRGGIGVRYYF